MRRNVVCAVCTACLAMLTLGATASEMDFAGYTPQSPDAIRVAIRLGPQSNAPEMRVVLDQRRGEQSTWYDFAVADTNLNGTLADDIPVKITRMKRLSDSVEFRFDVSAPFGDSLTTATHDLGVGVYRMEGGGGFVAGGETAPAVRAMCVLSDQIEIASDGSDRDRMLYVFAFGQDPPQIRKGGLLRFELGTSVTLEMKTEVKGSEIRVSSIIKDSQGFTLRAMKQGDREIRPHVKITGPRKTLITDEDLNYG